MVETKTEREWTIEQETVLFKAICRYKPAGQHKHFRMLCIYQMVNNSNIQSSSPLTIQDIWNKLSTLYNLEGLDELEDSSSFMAEEENGKEPLYYGSLGGSLSKDGTYLRDFGLPWGEFGSIIEEKAVTGDSRESTPVYESDGGIPESQANTDESEDENGDNADKGSEVESARNTPVESVKQGGNKRARTPVRKAAAPATARTTRSTRQRTAAKKRKETSPTPEAAEENKGDNAEESKEDDADQQSEKEDSPQPETTTSRSKRARTQSKPAAAKAKPTPSRRSNRRK